MRYLMAACCLAALAAACTTAPVEETPIRTDIGGQTGCVSLTAQDIGATSLDKRWIEAADGLPAYCEVTATLSPVEGSTIGVVYRLPEGWNGKVLGIGGGGWAGNVTLAAAGDGLRTGYATMQTDGGHAGTHVWNNSWAINPEAATDFAYRAIHLMTVSGKQLAAIYYGRDHDRAYYNGCSTGGRMGLMEAQRFPADYDAIIAGAPVYTLQVQTTALLRNQTFAHGNGAGGFSTAQLQMVQDAALAQCDGKDGLEDGLISDPTSCTWQPRTLQCQPGETEGCLSPQQVTALQAVYGGRRASDGSWMMHPVNRGGEAGWSIFMGTDGSGRDLTGGGGLIGLEPVIFGARLPDWSNFTEADYLTVRHSDFARIYEANNPDLSAFFERGGKLMVWFGLNDPGPSPVIGSDYAQAVMQANPAKAGDHFRYFTLPGVGHCAGGPGADLVDYLGVMDSWVESGSAPERLIGTKRDGSITRPHCAWPKVAHYSGGGDPNDPASWSCVPKS